METLALEAEDFPGGRAGRNAEHHSAVDGGYFYLSAKHGLLQRDGQFEADIVAVAGEETVRLDGNGDDRIAVAGRPRLPLAGQPDLGSFLDAFGKLEGKGLAVGQRDALIVERGRVLEGHRKAIG